MSSSNSSQSSEMVSNTPRLHWYSPTEVVPPFNLTVNFTLFPKFPTEIRHNIWAIASNELRNVDIWVRNLYITTVDDCGPFWAPYLLYTTAGVPSVLHASHESRTEALKYYTLDFGTRFKHDGHTYSSHELFPKFEVKFPPQVYINWREDRICLMRPEAFQEYITVDGNETEETNRIETFLAKCNRKNLRSLAVNTQLQGEDDFWGWTSASIRWPPFTDVIPRGGHLKELILFWDQNWEAPHDDVNFVNPTVRSSFGFSFEEVDEEPDKMVSYFLKNAKSTCLERLADVLPDNKDLKMTVDDVADSLNIRLCKVTYSPLESTQTNN